MWRAHPSSLTRRARRSSETLAPSLPLKQPERQWWKQSQSSTLVARIGRRLLVSTSTSEARYVPCLLLCSSVLILTSICIAVDHSAGAATGEEGASAAHLEPEAAPEATDGRAAQPAAAEERAAARTRRGHHARRHASHVGGERLWWSVQRGAFGVGCGASRRLSVCMCLPEMCLPQNVRDLCVFGVMNVKNFFG